ncbi:hypothetical protein F2P81_011835 [Scophthalmus maximus]|uniref:SAND domain-containing protein n=1 Tax=Scophthalmus maximus TaxID=52904 RepID=A0A6A4SRA7_SCOMX|nr:hypothetical protein F2P81_011835 [Scophthalmus maximus]
MASEVNMEEVSEVVIVTIPESVGEDLPSVVEEDKAVLVSAELTNQPGEEALTVAAVEAEAEAGTSDSLSKEEAVIVKLTEEVDVEADVFYPITCGDAKATLVWKKFVCPGINVKCVQFNEQLISPKEFVCLAGKSTLKDWKRAIRLNATMLRKIMDSGELDFYQHTKVCSNTCRSTKIDLVGTKVSVSSDQSADLVPVTPSSAHYAVLLNNIVQNFGMLDLVKKVLASHKSQMDRYREQYTRSLAALEQQCDEHRKRAKELKSKSQHLNNVLMTLTPVPAAPPPKRPRLTRTVSSPAKVNAAPTQITLPINQLTGLQLGKVLTMAGAPAGTTLGGYTLLTSSLSGSELVADPSNLTVLSTTAGQLVGPQFQLVTLPAALQSLATAQSTAVQQQVGSISVMDAMATVDDSQEDPQTDGEEEGQPVEVKEEEDGEQAAE